MFRRLLRLNLTTRRRFPNIDSRVLMDEKGNSNYILQTDDIVEELRVFTNAKLLAKQLSSPKVETVVPLFTELLKCNANEAKQIAERDKKFLKALTMKELRKQIETYIEVGFDRKLLLKNPELLSMIPGVVREKLEILHQMPKGKNGKGLNDYLPLMKLDIKDLKKFRDTLCRDERMKMQFGNRIHFLSKKLKVKPYIISEFFLKNHFLRTLRRSYIIENTNLFLYYKIPSQEILRSPYAFKSNPNTITQQRLELAKNILNKDDMRTWFTRASQKNYEKSLKYASENLNPLKEIGAKDNVEYLSKRLGFDEDEKQLFLIRYPRIKKVRTRILKAQLDFLLDEAGYPPNEISKIPQLFSCSVKTLRKHHEELKQMNHNMMSLYPLSLASKQWEKFVEKVKKDKNHYPPSEE